MDSFKILDAILSGVSPLGLLLALHHMSQPQMMPSQPVVGKGTPMADRRYETNKADSVVNQ